MKVNRLVQWQAVAAQLMCWLAISLTFVGSLQAAEIPIVVQMSVASDGVVRVEFTNSGEAPVVLLPWNTPFEAELSEDIFQIEDPVTGERSVYRGRLGKRGPPATDQLIHLAAGGVATAEVNLPRYYSLEKKGTYLVRFEGRILFQFEDDLPGVALDSTQQFNTVLISSDAILIDLAPAPDTRAAKTSLFDGSCSTDQREEIAIAVVAAERITAAALNDLVSLEIESRPHSPRYLRWFGRYTGSRFNTVLNGFIAAEEVFANGTLRFDCGCAEIDKFAYVRPADPYLIYLCPGFWGARLDGRDSRAGTLLHELTHFPQVRGTRDYAYGAVNAALLAQTDPSLSVLNADSYEFFAENSPRFAITPVSIIEQKYIDMVINQQYSGSVRAGENAYFRVEQAGAIELTSVGGDADLYVHLSSAYGGAVCGSISTGQGDRCVLDAIPDAYIQVLGFSDTDFLLEATPPVRVTVQGGNGGADSGAGSVSVWTLLLATIWVLWHWVPVFARRMSARANRNK
ncbi:hypothetical protein AB833_28745 [Chromatiales bacterium (ex Bugula neritina AB1)]|nr:hypothetical protein AB833_28745 [Chromatiales bacterium (ex Bugula neritina AB1)]